MVAVEARSLSVAQVGLRLVIFLPQLAECSDYVPVAQSHVELSQECLGLPAHCSLGVPASLPQTPGSDSYEVCSPSPGQFQCLS